MATRIDNEVYGVRERVSDSFWALLWSLEMLKPESMRALAVDSVGQVGRVKSVEILAGQVTLKSESDSGKSEIRRVRASKISDYDYVIKSGSLL